MPETLLLTNQTRCRAGYSSFTTVLSGEYTLTNIEVFQNENTAHERSTQQVAGKRWRKFWSVLCLFQKCLLDKKQQHFIQSWDCGPRQKKKKKYFFNKVLLALYVKKKKWGISRIYISYMKSSPAEQLHPQQCRMCNRPEDRLTAAPLGSTPDNWATRATSKSYIIYCGFTDLIRDGGRTQV